MFLKDVNDVFDLNVQQARKTKNCKPFPLSTQDISQLKYHKAKVQSWMTKSQKQLPCFKVLLLNLSVEKHLRKDLAEQENCILTDQINQDCIENCFLKSAAKEGTDSTPHLGNLVMPFVH